MNNTPWILIDTETTGFARPIYVVELAAQRMLGWKPQGPAFRKLLNQNQDIPQEVSRVHGYTREILERDGEPAVDVYRKFADYVGMLPLVSFHIVWDLDDVLIPEWRRLGIPVIGTRGLCALRLAERLLDPVPAGNCKLQTLRQYYRLPERGAHTALGDVQTVADLFGQVLRPIAEQRGLTTWNQIQVVATETWYPSRLSFGPHKGRLFWEAKKDENLRRWLDWLAGSSNARSRNMGQWYQRQLATAVEPGPESPINAVSGDIDDRQNQPVAGTSLAIFVNVQVENLQRMVSGARIRLAELEANYTRERARVDWMHAELFRRLRDHYQRRARIRLSIEYREKYLDALLRHGEDEANQATKGYGEARARVDRDYEEAAAAVADKRSLTPEEEEELARLWKKLVKLYHPDRFANEPDKLETYTKLTTAINRAKDSGDIKTLREIADDPSGFILRQGWSSLDFSDEILLSQLCHLYDTLQMQIVAVIETLEELRASPDFELANIVAKKPSIMDSVAQRTAQSLDAECATLEQRAAKLAEEIAELAGGGAFGIG